MAAKITLCYMEAYIKQVSQNICSSYVCRVNETNIFIGTELQSGSYQKTARSAGLITYMGDTKWYPKQAQALTLKRNTL